jgi:hypothetical protein
MTEEKTAFIICGALGQEVVDIAAKHDWNVDVYGVTALDHMFPERIAPDVEARILALREQYQRLIVVYGDCGSRGSLDEVLLRHNIERIEGPHCYEFYAGQGFDEIMEEELGSFFLTDFLVRKFRGTVMKGMGLDKYPHLKKEYFHNYKRVVYLMQKRDPKLVEKAQQIADYLELDFVIRETGYGLLEERLLELMGEN